MPADPKGLLNCLQALRTSDGAYSNKRGRPVGLTAPPPPPRCCGTCVNRTQRPGRMAARSAGRRIPGHARFPLPDMLSTATACCTGRHSTAPPAPLPATADQIASGIGEAVALARRSGVVVLVLGENQDMSGEAASRATLDLPGHQEQLLEAVAASGKPVVLVTPRRASPSAMAVLPTPGSPISTGLFFVRREGDLHDAADFLIAPDDRIELSLPGAIEPDRCHNAAMPGISLPDSGRSRECCHGRPAIPSRGPCR